ncbi:tetratricopeptide repeat protein [Lysobacter sp. CA199]|uniref:tetratricopeptide repeat protein n=1 Tax=Lysobacter sp. CA199 TaxID=3455608 RepID=UPI003F8D8AC9
MDIPEIKSLLEAGAIDTARARLLELVEFDPQEVRAWLLLSGLAFRTDDWPLAEKAAAALVELRPSDGLASSALVSCLVNAGRYPHAEKEIVRFNAIADGSGPNHQVVLQEHRATLERIRSLGQ